MALRRVVDSARAAEALVREHMPRTARTSPPVEQPTAAVRVVRGSVFRVARRPEGIASEVTTALQGLAKKQRSRMSDRWAVFPVAGRDLVAVGYLVSRAPLTQPHAFAVEPGGDLATTHQLVALGAAEGLTVGHLDSERTDADCLDELVEALSATPAWQALEASRVPLAGMPGGDGLDALDTTARILLTDDGRVGDVVYGMSFWRPGDTWRGGRVDTWARPVEGDGVVRVVGVSLAHVDAASPVALVPSPHWEELDALAREVRAVLDSPRPMHTWLVAGDAAGCA